MTQKSAADSVMDGGGLSGVHTPMEVPEATELLHRVYGSDGELTRLPSEKDDTFKVEINGAPKYVLKVANPHDPDQELDFQTKLLKHVRKADPSIPVPDVLLSIDGEELTTIVDAAGQTRKVWAIEFMPGRVLDTFGVEVPDLEVDELQKIGEVLGKLRNATTGFSHPLESRVIAWDVFHLLKIAPLLDFVKDPHRHENLAKGLARISELQPRIEKLRLQVLHNDFSRSNLLADRSTDNFITGIIDFGDASKTAIAVEVSTALINQLPRDLAQNPQEDIFAAGREVVRGYLRHSDLTNEELELIPHLTMARVIARALITNRRAELFPDNVVYIMRNTEPGWAQLDWFLARSIDEVSNVLAEFQSK